MCNMGNGQDLGGFPVSSAKLDVGKHSYVTQAALKLSVLSSVTKSWDHYRHAPALLASTGRSISMVRLPYYIGSNLRAIHGLSA